MMAGNTSSLEGVIRCGVPRCGHVAPFGAFCTRPVSGQLPPGTWQCPACGEAWRTVKSRDRLGRPVIRMQRKEAVL